MAHHGNRLKQLINSDTRTVVEIGKKMGYTRSRIYALYDIKVFSKNQLEKIAKASYDITKITDNKTEAIIVDSSIQIRKLEETVENLEETIDAVQEDSIMLNKKFNDLHRDYLNVLDIALKLQRELGRMNKKWRISEEKKILIPVRK